MDYNVKNKNEMKRNWHANFIDLFANVNFGAVVFSFSISYIQSKIFILKSQRKSLLELNFSLKYFFCKRKKK